MSPNILHLFLRLIVATVPGLAMMAAHWFPWRATLGRDLGKIESYTWGVAWIVGVAAATMRISGRLGAPMSPEQCARLTELAAASAGSATVAAHVLDYWTGQRRHAVANRIANGRKAAANA